MSDMLGQTVKDLEDNESNNTGRVRLSIGYLVSGVSGNFPACLG
jgi:hypothetical protein